MIGRLAVVGCVALALAGCAPAQPDLITIRKVDRTPDEFSILPSRPLQTPPDRTTLPAPTPGGTNRTDRAPAAEAIAALGGNPAGGTGGDSALIGAVSRFGVQANIRGQLATEDLAFRRANDPRLLERLFDVTTYFRAYRRQSLNKQAELERLRQAGVRTVAAPPRSADPGAPPPGPTRQSRNVAHTSKRRPLNVAPDCISAVRPLVIGGDRPCQCRP